MIYRKEANFPYPILSNSSYAYNNCEFSMSVTLQENVDSYRFHIEYELDSEFIQELLQKDKIGMLLIVQAKDNKFYHLKNDQSYIDIKKSRISLSKRTKLQLLLMAKEEISFDKNEELDSFYAEVREGLVVPKYTILGYSDVAIFDGSSKKPLELIEKRINPQLKSDINIELGPETIIINYKNEELQFSDSPKSNQLNHHYVYMGLQKVLYRFIYRYGQEEEVMLEEIEDPTDSLDFKLYNLLRSKMVDNINLDNVDEVIYKISDKILEKHAAAIKGLYTNGN